MRKAPDRGAPRVGLLQVVRRIGSGAKRAPPGCDSVRVSTLRSRCTAATTFLAVCQPRYAATTPRLAREPGHDLRTDRRYRGSGSRPAGDRRSGLPGLLGVEGAPAEGGLGGGVAVGDGHVLVYGSGGFDAPVGQESRRRCVARWRVMTRSCAARSSARRTHRQDDWRRRARGVHHRDGRGRDGGCGAARARCQPIGRSVSR